MRRAVKDSMMTIVKSGISTTMRWTMCGTTKNVVCRHGQTYTQPVTCRTICRAMCRAVCLVVCAAMNQTTTLAMRETECQPMSAVAICGLR
jgi:hypothetical protein